MPASPAGGKTIFNCARSMNLLVLSPENGLIHYVEIDFYAVHPSPRGNV
jgi:hypothetical protein